jgi:hypothetical protein
MATNWEMNADLRNVLEFIIELSPGMTDNEMEGYVMLLSCSWDDWTISCCTRPG